MIRDSYNCSNDFSDNSSLMYIYKKAINGDADQMQSLGDKYYIGEEVDQNYESVELLLKYIIS